LRPVAMDTLGLIPEAFEEACQDGRVGVLYTVPNLQNPTATILPESRREQIAEIARRYDVLILEDDIFGFLLWDDDEPCPRALSAYAPERSYFMTSLSKCALPALRVGYLLVPPGEAEKVAAYTRLTTSSAPSLFAEIARIWIEEGIMAKLATVQSQEAKKRQAIAREIMGEEVMKVPSSGFHFWLELPNCWTPANFITTAMSRGVALSAPDSFTIDHSLSFCGVRICVQSARDHNHLRQGLTLLKDLVAGGGHIAHPIA